LRVVLDSRGQLSPDSQLVRTIAVAPVLVVAAAPLAKDRRAALRALGCEVLELPTTGGRPSVVALLDELGRRRLTNVLVEGGAEVLGSFFDAGEIDEVHAVIAPKLVGGRAPTPMTGTGRERMAEAVALADCGVEVVEGDVWLRGRVGR
ncbi:MAG: RibD family protein, partial [Gemmataceae bacterium]|nr:RibD family protein [Gemmataceae bacterium]